jgi:hypothetical protein
VVDCRVDVSAANEAGGVRYSLVSSGSNKVYGHPCVAVTDAEITARQRTVDDLASVFFAHVQSARGLDSSSLHAAVYVGESARSAMLVDSVLGYREFLAALGPMAGNMTYEELMAALAEMAKGEGEDAMKAKDAIAKLEAEPAPAPDAPAAMADDAPAPKPDDSTVAQLAAQVQALSARIGELSAVRESDERKALLDSRDDMGAELRAVLADKPLAEVRSIVAALPKRAKFGAASTAAPTRGEGQVSAAVSSPEFDRLDTLMGVGIQKSNNVVRTATSLVLGSAKKGA